MNDETRRTASLLALAKYGDELCCLCQRPLRLAEWSKGINTVGYINGEAQLAHGVCFGSFVALLQTLPAERLHELISGKENDGGREGEA